MYQDKEFIIYGKYSELNFNNGKKFIKLIKMFSFISKKNLCDFINLFSYLFFKKIILGLILYKTMTKQYAIQVH